MGDQNLRGLQQQVDEIGGLLVDSAQQVTKGNESVFDMIDRSERLTEECAVFQPTTEPKMTKTRSSLVEPMMTTTGSSLTEPKKTRTRSSFISTTRGKVILGTCAAVGLFLFILICVLCFNRNGEEGERANETSDMPTNVTQPGP